MHLQEVESLRLYHSRRCEQEGRLAETARSTTVAERHRELADLHRLLCRDLDAGFVEQCFTGGSPKLRRAAPHSTLKRQITPKIPRALQDAQRTIRLVRSKAAEFGINPNRIGVLGMSAGGYLVAQTSNILTPTYRPVDATDKVSSRPDFAIALYPGHICRDDGLFDSSLPVTKAAPPTFIAQAWNDGTDPICNSLMYATALDKSGVSTEVHLFAEGGHAFALRHKQEPVGKWPELVELWLRQLKLL